MQISAFYIYAHIAGEIVVYARKCMAVIILLCTYIYKYMLNAIQYIINILTAMQTKLGLLRVGKLKPNFNNKTWTYICLR